MKRKIIKTADGSTTIFLEEWNEHYHSKHGAIQEAYHVFIKSGFKYTTENFPVRPLRILEIGFGTGLNALITLGEAITNDISVVYEGVEAFPVVEDEWKSLNYLEQLKRPDLRGLFTEMHRLPWGITEKIHERFTLKKRKSDFREITDQAAFDLVYFDAFGARVQPELWEEPVFNRMYEALDEQGVLVTYSSKGSVRRALTAVGFAVEKLPGPPGKREMVRAVKS